MPVYADRIIKHAGCGHEQTIGHYNIEVILGTSNFVGNGLCLGLTVQMIQSNFNTAIFEHQIKDDPMKLLNIHIRSNQIISSLAKATPKYNKEDNFIHLFSGDWRTINSVTFDPTIDSPASCNSFAMAHQLCSWVSNSQGNWFVAFSTLNPILSDHNIAIQNQLNSNGEGYIKVYDSNLGVFVCYSTSWSDTFSMFFKVMTWVFKLYELGDIKILHPQQILKADPITQVTALKLTPNHSKSTQTSKTLKLKRSQSIN